MEGSALLPQRDATVYDRVDLVDEVWRGVHTQR